MYLQANDYQHQYVPTRCDFCSRPIGAGETAIVKDGHTFDDLTCFRAFSEEKVGGL